MKNKLLAMCITLISCSDEFVNDFNPQVTPEIVSIGTTSAIVKWNNVGNSYYYAVLISRDSILDNRFINVCPVIDSTTDTVFTINGLVSKTYYKVEVTTIGGNKFRNDSWPPLLFKTE